MRPVQVEHGDLPRTPIGHRRCHRDVGSVLMLMPAAVLIVFVLGAIAVDMSAVYLARRELVDAAAAAANDAVTIGMNEASLRSGDGFILDPDLAAAGAERSLAAAGILDRLAAPPIVTVTGPDRIRIDLVMEVDYIFVKALPGNHGHTTVVATATATAARR